MAPFDFPKFPKVREDVTVLGKRGVSLPHPISVGANGSPLVKAIKIYEVRKDGDSLVLKNRFNYKAGDLVGYQGLNYRVVKVLDGLELKPAEDTGTQRLEDILTVAVTTKSEVFALNQKTNQDPVALTQEEISEGTTQVFFIEGAANLQSFFEHYGIEFTSSVKQRLAIRELQLGLRAGELENPPVDLPELGRRRAQINRLTAGAQFVITDIYKGDPLRQPMGLRTEEINEMAEWAQWGKKMGISQEMVIEALVTHISRKSLGTGGRDHRHTLRDIVETAEFARSGAEHGGKERGVELSPEEKRAAFLASMDPNIARFFLDAKDEKGLPLFSQTEKFLYEQFGILRIFLENGGTPNPKNLMQYPEERDAFLSVLLPSTLRSEADAERIISQAMVELL
jgi:hypothetical protein